MTTAHAFAAVLTEQIDEDTRATLINNALPIAGLFVLLLLIAMYFLWRSMRKQMGKISPDLPPGIDDRAQAADRQRTQDAIERGRQEAAARKAAQDAANGGSKTDDAAPQ